MINAIGAMHATLRAKKQPDDQVHFLIEAQKRRRREDRDEEDDRPSRKRPERGQIA